MTNKFSTAYNAKTNILTVYDDRLNCKGIIIIEPEKLEYLFRLVSLIPKDFGHVYPEHLIDLASQCDLVTLKPLPSWAVNIQGSATQEQLEREIRNLAQVNKLVEELKEQEKSLGF